MGALERFEFTQIRMGVDTRIVVYAPDEERAVRACRDAYKRIAELEERLSDYRADSELNRLCERAVRRWVQVSPELFYVLWRAQRLAQQTDGAFDITLGPLVALWRESRRTQKLPPPVELEEARQRSGWRKLRLNRARRAVWLEMPNMRLDLGGIAKGYACDHALRVLRRHGLTRALVQMGGDLAVGDAPPDSQGWQVLIPPLSTPDTPKTLFLTRCALSTSGSTEQYVEIEGKRYAHIIDPRTGLGLSALILASVKAPDGITSDSLATALAVMGEAGVPKLRRHYPRIEVWLQQIALDNNIVSQ